MRNKKGIFILLTGLTLSLLSAYLHTDTTSLVQSSLAVFTVISAFMVAAIAFPQLAPILSNSIITKNLLPEFYKQPKYWIFLLYQAMLALSSLFIFLNYRVGNMPPLCFKGFLFLLVFDFFYILYYLDDLKSLIQSPRYMLKKYRHKTKKSIEKSLKMGMDYFTSFLQNYRRIGVNTKTCDDKELILNTYDFLLLSLGKIKIRDYSDGNGSISQQLLLEAWVMLVEGVCDSCVLSNEPNSVNDKNIASALEILKMSWGLMVKKKLRKLDYSIYIEAVKRLALSAINRNFDKSPRKSVDLLNSIALASIPGFPHDSDTLTVVIPLHIAGTTIKDIGKAAIKAQKDDVTVQCIIYLVHYLGLGVGKQLIYMLDAFYLIGLVWDSNPDLLENFSRIPEILEEDQMEKALEYGEEFSPVETASIKRFFKEIKESPSNETSTFIKKFKEKFKHFLKKIK